MKVIKRRMAEGRSNIFNLKDSHENETTNRQRILAITEQFYRELYTTLFNLCLQNSIIPDKCTDLENYTPISLLSHLYKLLTKIINKQLEQKLDF